MRPWLGATVPARIIGSVSTEVEGPVFASASLAAVTVSNQIVLQSISPNGVGNETDFVTTARLSPWLEVTVSLGVQANAGRDAFRDERGWAKAEADPVFEFGQEASDQMTTDLGRGTFPLADYYEFEFSSNISEPATLSPLALGGLALLLHIS